MADAPKSTALVKAPESALEERPKDTQIGDTLEDIGTQRRGRYRLSEERSEALQVTLKGYADAASADAEVRIAEAMHLGPAQEATKQAQEVTKQTEIIAKQETRRHLIGNIVVIVCVLSGIVGAIQNPESASSIAAIVAVISGIVKSPDIIEQIKKKDSKGL